ncbi:MAG: acyl-CoA desaturase [bacterium]|nr:acyl-CoA desaturase [bacterium]
MSKTCVVKFNVGDRPEFFKELKIRINRHFKENNISRYANANMVCKTAFMLILYFSPMVLMYTGIIKLVWVNYMLWVLMGFGMSGIGLTIMHDANHGSYSRHKIINRILGFTLNFLGAYHINWKIQHNVLHHTFTNIHDFDEDIDKGVMRFSPTQDRKGIFTYQIFYAPFFYALMTIYWLIAKDFELIFRYKKKNLLKAQGLTLGKGLVHIVFHKVWYLIMIVAIPIFTMPIAWVHVVLGFLLMHFISGFILAMVFQPAHITENTSFYKVDENSSVENNWAIHQMHTTSNYGNGSLLFSWFIGGINFQIEHHLFPNICHIHYPQISKIVKATAEEYNVPYYSHKTFLDALRSHFTVINKLGTGQYDKEMKQSTAIA